MHVMWASSGEGRLAWRERERESERALATHTHQSILLLISETGYQEVRTGLFSKKQVNMDKFRLKAGKTVQSRCTTLSRDIG